MAGKIERVKVLRHPRLYRIIHWTIVILIALLFISGIQISGIFGNVPFVEDSRAFHVFVGTAWVALAIVFLYYLAAVGDLKWLIRLGKGLRFFWAEAKAWLGVGPHVEEPIAYDPEKKEYVEKIVPTEALAFLAFFVLALIVGITGILLAFPEYFEFVVSPIQTAVLVRSSHLVGAFLLLALIIIHVYAGFVYKMLRSIVFGDRDEPVAKPG